MARNRCAAYVGHRPTSQEKSGALSDHSTSDKAASAHSPDVPVWRDGDHTNERGGSLQSVQATCRSRKNPSFGRLVQAMRTQSPPNPLMAVFSSSRSAASAFCSLPKELSY